MSPLVEIIALPLLENPPKLQRLREVKVLVVALFIHPKSKRQITLFPEYAQDEQIRLSHFRAQIFGHKHGKFHQCTRCLRLVRKLFKANRISGVQVADAALQKGIIDQYVGK